MKAYRFELVGGYKNGCLSAPDSCTVEVNANTIEEAAELMNNAICTVERFAGMRVYESYEKTVDVTWFDGIFDVYDINGNVI